MVKKSILILGSFSSGALELQYAKNLKAQSWQIKCIDIQEPVNLIKNKNLLTKSIHFVYPSAYYEDLNKVILKEAAMFKPMVILIFKGMELFPETVEELKNHCKFLCNYNPDHPFEFYSRGAGNSNVEKSIKFFDTYFSYSNSICKKLKNSYGIDSFCIPFGYDAQVVPIKKHEHFITDQFLFIGAWDKEREHNIKKLTDIDLQVYGPEIWAKKLKFKKQIKYHSKPLYEQNYADACLNAGGVLNFLRPQNILEQSHNMRTFEVPGYSGLLISERTEEQLSFFEEDKEAVYFSNIEELKQKLKYYASNRSSIAKIKDNALKRSVKSNYSYKHRAELLTTFISNQID